MSLSPIRAAMAALFLAPAAVAFAQDYRQQDPYQTQPYPQDQSQQQSSPQDQSQQQYPTQDQSLQEQPSTSTDGALGRSGDVAELPQPALDPWLDRELRKTDGWQGTPTAQDYNDHLLNTPRGAAGRPAEEIPNPLRDSLEQQRVLTDGMYPREYDRFKAEANPATAGAMGRSAEPGTYYVPSSEQEKFFEQQRALTDGHYPQEYDQMRQQGTTSPGG